MDDVEEARQPIDVEQLARERAGEVEPEAIDVHLVHPVPQAVHDQLQHLGALHVERVPAPGEVHVVARVVGHEPVVRGVVDPLQRQRRAEVVAFGGVVVDDVEDDFEAGGVERAHHPLELADRARPACATPRTAVRARSSRSCCSPSSSSAPFPRGADRARCGAPASTRPRSRPAASDG